MLQVFQSLDFPDIRRIGNTCRAMNMATTRHFDQFINRGKIQIDQDEACSVSLAVNENFIDEEMDWSLVPFKKQEFLSESKI
ncbi:hypothetical protein O9G_002342 [Rozella allomycis CSF55]|uniref:Uncharacterized protein n=1 Tax=Rozella allomycis (strain CSF55) TaxID=988480 RepID=A0A075B4X6_ROZAC|nr:hypothetical protein O9G_002342 [Rozella allomycis CSF55]|eukprot:EPZ36731.1 hypothetical protein O9G_002342 [Rozella allomycis CSF55]